MKDGIKRISPYKTSTGLISSATISRRKKIQKKEYKESKRNIKPVFFSLTETIKGEK